MKNLILGIKSQEAVTWKSCISISDNLSRAYSFAFKSDYIELECKWLKPTDVFSTVDKIIDLNPSKIVFLDHTPLADTILKPLALAKKHNRPNVDIHVYGDFTRMIREWIEMEETLLEYNTKLIVPSKKQRSHIGKYLRKGDQNLSLCKFPLNDEDFYYSPPIRSKFRGEFGIDESELLVVYAGRRSLQKNLSHAINHLISFSTERNLPIRIGIAGSFDQIGSPLFGLSPGTHDSRKEWLEHFESLPSDWKERVTDFGELNSQELNQLYNGADLFISLSHYHDEDFGMAPAEAMMTGLPTVLSDWGGYSDFADSEICDVIPYKISVNGVSMSADKIYSGLNSALSLAAGCKNRSIHSSNFRNSYSCQAVSNTIAEIESQDDLYFQGFSDHIYELAEYLNRKVPFPEGPRSGGGYEKHYSPYYEVRRKT